MSADFEWILEDCLKRLRSGQSPEDCLAAYPEHAEGLRPLLQTATHLQPLPVPQPRSQAIQAGRERMLVAASSNLGSNSSVQPVSSGAFSRYTARIITTLKEYFFGKEIHGMKLALRFAIDFAVLLVIGGVLAVNASASSLPGDPLYGVKRTWEDVRLTLTLNDPARQQLQNQFQQLRVEEVQQMIQLGKTGMVDFDGQLESIAADEWIVSGIHVRMLPDTIVAGDPVVGQAVRVRSRLQSEGVLTALQVNMHTQVNNPISYPSPAINQPAMQAAMPSQMPWSTQVPMNNLEPMHEPTYQPGMNDDHHEELPAPTSMPNDDHHDNHGDPGSMPGMGSGLGTHHSMP